MVLDLLENWPNYCLTQRLRRAFELLITRQVLALPDGRHELEPGIIALPQGYLTKPRSEGRWEAHRQFIDIQYVITGREVMGWAPVVSLAPDTAFDAEKDVGFYTGTGDFMTVQQGMFALFMPQDAHMPCLSADQAEPVRKIVVKVAL
jgi:YhcH/YjgK/YiaL family protein